MWADARMSRELFFQGRIVERTKMTGMWIEILHIGPLPNKAKVKFHSKQHITYSQR